MFSREHLEYAAVDLPDRAKMTDQEMQDVDAAFIDHMTRRHTIRDYSTCDRAAGTAPSGANHQPWYFTAISDPEIKKNPGRSRGRREKILRWRRWG